jgi:hypothetical protein
MEMGIRKHDTIKRGEYRTRAPLADELLDLAAESSRLTARLGTLSERIRQAETAKAARGGTPEAA